MVPPSIREVCHAEQTVFPQARNACRFHRLRDKLGLGKDLIA